MNTNQQNAQHSTGPKTAEGKKTSSMNALRHGLTGQIVVMPSEDLSAYQKHLADFQAEYSPSTPTEAHLVQSLADTSWRLNRAASLESNLLALPAVHHEDPLQAALAIAAALDAQARALANLSMHSQRLSRQFERTVNQLRALQKERLAQEQSDLNSLLDIAEMCESEGDSFDASDYGFVFSDSRIEDAAKLRTRKHSAEEARHYHLAASAA